MNILLLRAALSAIEDEVVDLPAVAEAGRVFSAANEQALKAVATAIAALLAQVQQAPMMPDGMAPTVVSQAADAAAETIAQEAVVPLSEAARGGKGLIKVIDAGWGTSGFYSPAVLERDAGVAFPAGTRMFWDHPTIDEARNRPERSLRDLAARTTGPARWMKDGPDGPAVYAPAEVLSAYRPSLEEMADHIGVSIRSSARITQGEAEGKRGPIVERLLPSEVNSIDFVTVPGRGGRVAALFEAARGRNIPEREDEDMGDTEDQMAAQEALTAAQRERDEARQRAERAELAVAMLSARDTATEALAGIDIPDVAKAAVIERMTSNPPMKDGALDVDALKAAVAAEGAREKAYIDKITGRGEVRGMGSGAPTTPDPAALAGTFQRLGLSEAAAKTAAAGR